MDWVVVFVGSPARAAVTLVVITALVSFFWPGVVAHALWVLLSVAATCLIYFLWELKWVFGLGLACAAYFSFRRLL